MRYHELLREYIRASGLSLSEISERLQPYGFHIDKSYISKLQSGKTGGPATDELNRALAAVTGGDVQELLTASLVEKTPEELREDILRYLTLTHLKKQYTEEEKNLYLAKLSSAEAALAVREAEEEYNVLKAEAEQIGLVRIPVLGHIAAGRPLFADDHIVDWEHIPKPANYKPGEIFALIVKGDSMIGARIFEGDKVVVKVQPEVEDGEIAVINVDGENATLKRVKRVNGQVLLLAENPKYEPIVIESDKARVCGKVIQVIFDPNTK